MGETAEPDSAADIDTPGPSPAESFPSGGAPLSWPSFPTVQACLPHVTVWREAIEYFLRCTGCIFPTITPAQIDQLFTLVTGSERPSNAVLGEICAVAAVGAQYSKGKISGTQGDILYSMAKQFLESVINADRVAAVRVCTLLSAYSIDAQGAAAIVSVGRSCRLLPTLTVETANKK